jgi:dihydrofolate reductase
MGKLVVGTFLTLDGVMQGPGGPEEDTEGGFEHGGWSVPFWGEGEGDEVMGQFMDESMGRADALLLGRKTYEIFAAHWPNVGGDDPMAAKLNSVDKYVASNTLDNVEWRNSALIEGDVAEEVAKLKDDRAEIQVPGSQNLIQTLLKHDLVDEFRLLIFPVVLGSGKKLFADGTIPTSLKLVDTKTSGTGVALNTYEAAGRAEYGSFALEQ